MCNFGLIVMGQKHGSWKIGIFSLMAPWKWQQILELMDRNSISASQRPFLFPDCLLPLDSTIWMKNAWCMENAIPFPNPLTLWIWFPHCSKFKPLSASWGTRSAIYKSGQCRYILSLTTCSTYYKHHLHLLNL